MGYEDIDRAIERYAQERWHESRQTAQQHFLTYAYVVCGAGEVESFLRVTRSIVSYQIASLSLFDNPFRNSQFCWLLLMICWFCFNVLLITEQEFCRFGLINCAGTIIFGSLLWKCVWSRWIETCLRIDYYQEIIDCIDSQQLSSDSEAAAC